MGDVTIEIFPVLLDAKSEAFSNVLSAAIEARKEQFTYRKTIFHIGYRPNGEPADVRVVLKDMKAPLPAVFRGELHVRMITLRSRIPRRLRAQPGAYVGANFGFPDAVCYVDPDRVITNDSQIFANGEDREQVIGLFLKVMTGKLEPGRNGDQWNTDVH